jgi:hypothetical protein
VKKKVKTIIPRQGGPSNDYRKLFLKALRNIERWINSFIIKVPGYRPIEVWFMKFLQINTTHGPARSLLFTPVRFLLKARYLNSADPMKDETEHDQLDPKGIFDGRKDRLFDYPLIVYVIMYFNSDDFKLDLFEILEKYSEWPDYCKLFVENVSIFWNYYLIGNLKRKRKVEKIF